MEKICTLPKMSKIDLDSLHFEIILSIKGSSFRARTSKLTQIPNVKNERPEATSVVSYENAIQKLIPKIEEALNGTNKQLSSVYKNDDGRIFFSVKNIIYQSNNISSYQNNSSILLSNVLIKAFENISKLLPNNNVDVAQVSNAIVSSITTMAQQQNQVGTIENKEKVIFSDVILKWLKHLLNRTKKSPNDVDYLSLTTLEGYNRVLRDHVFPYLKDNPEYDTIQTFSENNVDEILKRTSSIDTKRILLLALKLIFEYAKENRLIAINPIENKKLKEKKKGKKDYDFIEEEQRALWINCMIKEVHSIEFDSTDAPLAFLCTLLHGNRPEETCGTKWKDFDLKENDYHIQNAFKKLPIYNEETMKRIGWKKADGPLKTPESDRHLSLDLLFKQLLLEHRINQMYKYRKMGKKWSENEYVFLNTKGTPFTPDTLSKNFTKFIARNNLPKIVIYGLRHSFATHCRNLGVKPEVLARLMGHTEYETTQKYYIHISKKQKREELQKVQQQDLQKYLNEENKDYVHLQNKINNCNKQISNLQEIQKEDLTQYLQIDDKTLNVLKELIVKINQKEKIAV